MGLGMRVVTGLSAFALALTILGSEFAGALFAGSFGLDVHFNTNWAAVPILIGFGVLDAWGMGTLLWVAVRKRGLSSA